MRNHLCCSALVLLAVFGCGGTAAVQCRWAEGCVCLRCPAGQEPSKSCGTIQSPTEEVHCQPCPTGSFSDAQDSELCRPHTSCETLGREVAAAGSATSDVKCGKCLSGFKSTDAVQLSNQTPCVKTAPRVRTIRTVGKGPAGGSGGPANSTVVRSAEEKTAEYAVFALVPIFCVMGLLGILICNILKKKGYRCTAEKEGGDEESATPQKEGNGCPYISDDLNEDTISVLVRLITEKKENAAALEELLLEYESKQMSISKGSSIKFPMLSPFRSLPRLCPHQSHLHTISGLSGLAPKHGYRCSRCAHKKWPPVLIPPLESLKDPLKPPQSLILPSLDPPIQQQKRPLLGGVFVDTHRTQAAVPKPVQERVEGGEVKEKEGELTVLSVGRFQVAQIPEQKLAEPKFSSSSSSSTSSSHEHRSSLFGVKHFCSSAGIRR